MQEARFSHEQDDQLAEPTVHSALDYVAQTFQANNRPDPRYDQHRKLAYILQRQFQAYRNLNPTEKLQKALTAYILWGLCNLASTQTDKAMSQLLIGSFFFAMRFVNIARQQEQNEQKSSHWETSDLSRDDTSSVTQILN